MTNTNKFEDFLRTKHAEDYIGTDDDMSDAFEHWLSNLDPQELIDLANKAIIKASISLKTYKQYTAIEIEGKTYIELSQLIKIAE